MQITYNITDMENWFSPVDSLPVSTKIPEEEYLQQYSGVSIMMETAKMKEVIRLPINYRTILTFPLSGAANHR